MGQRAMDREATIRAIHQAFAGVSRANGVTLHEAQVIDDHGSDQARQRARSRDSEAKWEQVPPEDIAGHYSTLSFLDPVGFKYYIPAFMTWTLRNYDVSDSLTVDHTIYALNPSLKPKLRTWQLERYSIFSEEQAVAVAAFLRYLAENADGCADDGAANEALHDYWARYEKADS